MVIEPDFELERDSPADRRARQEAMREIAARANRRRREREAKQGLRTLCLTLPEDTIALIDAIQCRSGLRNRSAAAEQLLKERFTAEDIQLIKRELGL